MNPCEEIMPKTLRQILQTDNEGIINLCKKASLPLRKNAKGLTFFTGDDVRILQNLAAASIKKVEKPVCEKPVPTMPVLPVNTDEAVNALKEIAGSVKNLETSFCDKFAEVLDSKLEEKLGGLDEVIIDLVRSKTENDKLRSALNSKESEIYALKNQLSSYKKVWGNFCIKTDEKKSEFD